MFGNVYDQHLHNAQVFAGMDLYFHQVVSRPKSSKWGNKGAIAVPVVASSPYEANFWGNAVANHVAYNKTGDGAEFRGSTPMSASDVRINATKGKIRIAPSLLGLGFELITPQGMRIMANRAVNHDVVGYELFFRAGGIARFVVRSSGNDREDNRNLRKLANQMIAHATPKSGSPGVSLAMKVNIDIVIKNAQTPGSCGVFYALTDQSVTLPEGQPVAEVDKIGQHLRANPDHRVRSFTYINQGDADSKSVSLTLCLVGEFAPSLATAEAIVAKVNQHRSGQGLPRLTKPREYCIAWSDGRVSEWENDPDPDDPAIWLAGSGDHLSAQAKSLPLSYRLRNDNSAMLGILRVAVGATSPSDPSVDNVLNSLPPYEAFRVYLLSLGIRADPKVILDGVYALGLQDAPEEEMTSPMIVGQLIEATMETAIYSNVTDCKLTIEWEVIDHNLIDNAVGEVVRISPVTPLAGVAIKGILDAVLTFNGVTQGAIKQKLTLDISNAQHMGDIGQLTNDKIIVEVYKPKQQEDNIPF